MKYDITVVELSPQPVAIVRGTEPAAGIGAFLGTAFGTVMEAITAQGVAPAGPPFARYEMAGDRFEIAAGFPVSAPVVAHGDVEPAELPGGVAAQTTHVGSYEAVCAGYTAIEGWLARTGRRPAGAPWEQYLDEPTVPLPRTLITFPCSVPTDPSPTPAAEGTR